MPADAVLLFSEISYRMRPGITKLPADINYTKVTLMHEGQVHNKQFHFHDFPHIHLKLSCNFLSFHSLLFFFNWLYWGLTTHKPSGSFCVVSQRKRRKIEEMVSGGDEREGQGRKWKMNENEETEEIKTSPPPPSTLTSCKASRPCWTVS